MGPDVALGLGGHHALPGAARGLDHRLGFLVADRHGFGNEYVLTGFKRADDLIFVKVIGRIYAHDIDFRTFEEGVEAPGCEVHTVVAPRRLTPLRHYVRTLRARPRGSPAWHLSVADLAPHSQSDDPDSQFQTCDAAPPTYKQVVLRCADGESTRRAPRHIAGGGGVAIRLSRTGRSQAQTRARNR